MPTPFIVKCQQTACTLQCIQVVEFDGYLNGFLFVMVNEICGGTKTAYTVIVSQWIQCGSYPDFLLAGVTAYKNKQKTPLWVFSSQCIKFDRNFRTIVGAYGIFLFFFYLFHFLFFFISFILVVSMYTFVPTSVRFQYLKVCI